MIFVKVKSQYIKQDEDASFAEVCHNISMKKVIKHVKPVKLLNVKLLYQLNVLWFLLIWPYKAIQN